MFEKLPPDLQQIIGAAPFLIPASLSRLLWQHRLVRRGQRRFWSWELVWEIPTAGLCAIVGGGLASYLGLDSLATHAVVGVVGWLGPRGLEVIVTRLVERFVTPQREGR